MAFCHQCGGEIMPGDRFCAQCGAPVRGAEPPAGAQASPAAAPPPPPPPPGAQAAGAAAPDPQPAGVPQGVGIRFAAQFIDAFPSAVFYGLALWRLAPTYGRVSSQGYELTGAPAVVVILLCLLFWLAYFTVMEGFNRGQTLGKMACGIRVTGVDGGPIGFRRALVRNLLRLVDGIACYLVGAILVWRSPLKQRLGDRVADTVVVKSR